MQNVTTRLAGLIAASSRETVNESAGDEAVRALVNWLGCALVGSQDPALTPVVGAFGFAAGPPQVTLLGRGDRTDVLCAALIGAMGSDLPRYVDTQPTTGTGVGAVIGGALMPLAEHRGARGADVIHAYVLGMEVACRMALALGLPSGARGMPASAVCGVVGAAAGAAKLLELDEHRTLHALGIAATQAGGGSEVGSGAADALALGFAARHGVFAALLAAQGFDSSDRAIDGERGLLRLLGGSPQPEALVQGWGNDWQFTRLAYHRYPCDIASHPVIEACAQLKREHRLTDRQIVSVCVRVHPSHVIAAPSRDPQTSRDAKRSVHHAAASALLDGDVTLRHFDRARLASARLKALRARVEVLADAALPESAARITIERQDDLVLECRIRCALGHPLRPMSDQQLSDKFRDLAAETLASDQAERLLALAWNVRALSDIGALIRASVPEEASDLTEEAGSPLLRR